ncbi:MAG: ribonuclease III [Kiritimatiellia bacterium]
MIGLFKTNPYRDLEKALGYTFRSKDRLAQAFLHRSFRFEKGGDAGDDNQRLEFLGDAVLGLVAAATLFAQFPDKDEGLLTAMRSRLTSGAALAELARKIDLGSRLKLGKGEEQTGGRQRSSNLADTLEAILGAAYLDGGLKAPEAIFHHLFVPHLELGDEAEAGANPKGRLQQICQQRWKISPFYVILSEEGPRHAREYLVQVRAGEQELGRGSGSSKRAAETAAALEALAKIPLEMNDETL